MQDLWVTATYVEHTAPRPPLVRLHGIVQSLGCKILLTMFAARRVVQFGKISIISPHIQEHYQVRMIVEEA